MDTQRVSKIVDYLIYISLELITQRLKREHYALDLIIMSLTERIKIDKKPRQEKKKK